MDALKEAVSTRLKFYAEAYRRFGKGSKTTYLSLIKSRKYFQSIAVHVN